MPKTSLDGSEAVNTDAYTGFKACLLKTGVLEDTSDFTNVENCRIQVTQFPRNAVSRLQVTFVMKKNIEAGVCGGVRGGGGGCLVAKSR